MDLRLQQQPVDECHFERDINNHDIAAEAPLLDLVSSLPLLDTTRIHDELGWAPRVSSIEAMSEVLTGMVDHAGGDTPTLAGDSMRGRLQEIRTGTGERYSVDQRS